MVNPQAETLEGYLELIPKNIKASTLRKMVRELARRTKTSGK